MNIGKIRELSKDVVLNLLAVAVSTGTVQLLLYPIMAKELGPEGYGTMLTIMGVVNLLAISFGNNLCNARILENHKYKEINIKGDFQIYLIIFSVLSFLIILGTNLYFKLESVLSIGLAIATVLIIIRSYYLVEYRLNINYKKNLYANIVLSIAYLLGAFIFIKTCGWPFIFVFSNVLCLLYIWFSSNIIKEPLKKTPLFKSTGNVVFMLLLSGLIGNLTSYLDRFIVFPFLGGDGVSCYTTAAYFTKSTTLVVLPITSVFLTYLSVDKITINKKRFNVINMLIVAGLALYCLVSVTLGRWITGLLFPTLIGAADAFILIASVGVLIGVAIAFVGTFVLVIAPTYWQTIISAIRCALYIVLCTILVKKDGIYGLCIGVIITNIICYVINYGVAIYYINKKEQR